MPTRPGQVFQKTPCHVCGKPITINGMGSYSHQKKHEREREAEALRRARIDRDNNGEATVR